MLLFHFTFLNLKFFDLIFFFSMLQLLMTLDDNQEGTNRNKLHIF